ncbi:diaminopimelate epimerase [Eubacteriales bacterium OttesenSCG-928-A19]|nr:diaminopimelate epimerase [Eubacteriales bacterium OttesenSCG-928-A19]
MRFVKMQGAGNDYVYVNGFTERVEDPNALAIAMSEPHFGVGADGLILILPSERADFRMRMFNKDGREGAMCGNGARCVGRFVYEQGLTDRTSFTLETGGGIREIWLDVADGEVRGVRVDMGAPQAYRREKDRAFVSMGSLHMVYRVEEDPFAWKDFDRIGGPMCEAEDANIEYVQVLSPEKLRMRVYERGSGETLACGSGACASAVAMQRDGACDRRVKVEMRGGTLEIELCESDEHVLMTGPAVTVFEGVWKG